jgi:hypothetical protein
MLMDQRLRNRVMEALHGVADWQNSIKNVGLYEHFETFFGWFPYEGKPYPNEAMTGEEQGAAAHVHALMIEAYSLLPACPMDYMTETEYVATGWPERMAPIAEQAVRIMLKRGRFSEDVEEELPTTSDGWPWDDRFKAA